MTIFHSAAPPLPPLPDDKTTVQFLFDSPLPQQPQTPPIPESPCHVDEITGRKIYLGELKERVNALATSLQNDYQIGEGDIVLLYSQNHMDFPTSLWAAHRVGAIVAPVSSSLTHDELLYQLDIAQPNLVIVHANGLQVAEQVLEKYSGRAPAVIVFDKPKEVTRHTSMDDVIANGFRHTNHLREYNLKPGEAKHKVAFLCFSSGTTGKPKAVALSHYNIISNVAQIAYTGRTFEAYTDWERRRFRPGDVALGVLPMYRMCSAFPVSRRGLTDSQDIYGLVCVIHFYIYAGMTLVICPSFDFARFLKTISQYRITHLMIVPPQGVLLVKHPLAKNADLTSLRFVTLGAAPATAELMDQLLRILPKTVELGQGYGLTELGGACTMFPTESRIGAPGSVGQLLTGTMAKIVKSDGQLGQVGEAGDLYLKGPQVALGYWRNEQATKEVFLADGWLRTGDQVVFDSNSNMYIVDRIKEILKVKGLQVSPAELEGHLLGHPLIADTGVVGVPDTYSGELPLAFVVLQPSAAQALSEKSKEDEIRRGIYQFVADAKMRAKWLDGGIVFIQSIPKSPSGKILRRVMKENVKAMSPIDMEMARVKMQGGAKL